MPTLKQGDLIKDKDGDMRKVLGVCGEVVHVSHLDAYNSFDYTTDEASLKNHGYTWDTPALEPAWEPSINQSYWRIGSVGKLIRSNWDDDRDDRDIRDFLGIYQTKKLCEAALLEIRRKLGK